MAMKSPSTRRRRGRSPSADERLERLVRSKKRGRKGPYNQQSGVLHTCLLTAAVSGWYTHVQEFATAQEDRADGVGTIHQSMCVCACAPHSLTNNTCTTPAMVQQARREHRMRNDRVRPGPGAVPSHPAHQPAGEFSSLSRTHTHTHVAQVDLI